MKARYRLFLRRKSVYYAFDTATRKFQSLDTKDRQEAERLPNIAGMKESDRAKAFIRRLRLVGVSGVSLHSYRYAWAERAKSAGYPERFAQEALGHGSKAVHRAYARHALVKIPSLEDYERQAADQTTRAV